MPPEPAMRASWKRVDTAWPADRLRLLSNVLSRRNGRKEADRSRRNIPRRPWFDRLAPWRM